MIYSDVNADIFILILSSNHGDPTFAFMDFKVALNALSTVHAWWSQNRIFFLHPTIAFSSTLQTTRQMVKKQKKKQPITARVQPTEAKFKHSRVETARLIRKFHVLNKELAKCKADPQFIKREQEILKEMEAMGGLDWYQKASQLGQSKSRGGDSSKWLIQTLKSHCNELVDLCNKPVKVLDIGAVAPDNYKPYSSWITAKPIDLNPQDPAIQKQDFLQMKPPSSDDDKFDIVCLSLVINFVGDPKDRGR